MVLAAILLLHAVLIAPPKCPAAAPERALVTRTISLPATPYQYSRIDVPDGIASMLKGLGNTP